MHVAYLVNNIYKLSILVHMGAAKNCAALFVYQLMEVGGGGQDIGVECYVYG